MKLRTKSPKHELGSLLRKTQSTFRKITNNGWKLRTLYALSRCRTAAMGGHIDKCDHKDCQRLHLSYNSCRNRHCPKCQGHLREKWIADREADLLDCTYFHVVFTLPDSLNDLALHQPRLIYGALFQVAWRVIKDFGFNPKFLGAKTGMIAVLHTWGQNLSLHPHLHCIVPGGGISQNDKWKHSKSKGKYLFPAKSMAKVFRARFVAVLRKQQFLDKTLTEKLFSKQWVVYCKQPFLNPKHVVEYLGRYSHKIAISNHRVKSMDGKVVSFTAKDYRQAGKKKMLSLDTQEFIRRFSLHILPKGFTRIRHYGLLASSVKGFYKAIVDKQIGFAIQQTNQPAIHHKRCPFCKRGSLHTILTFDERGPPVHWLKELKMGSAKAKRIF